MARPLDGVRVLEFGNFIAGPFCGMLIADMGADVIKIEPPKGEPARAIPPIIDGESASYATLNRNKRSLVLDLKTPEAIEVVHALVRVSDAVIENNRITGNSADYGGGIDCRRASPTVSDNNTSKNKAAVGGGL